VTLQAIATEPINLSIDKLFHKLAPSKKDGEDEATSARESSIGNGTRAHLVQSPASQHLASLEFY